MIRTNSSSNLDKNVVSSSTRGVLEKDGENQIVDKKVINYFCMFSILHIELKLKKNFNNVV